MAESDSLVPAGVYKTRAQAGWSCILDKSKNLMVKLVFPVEVRFVEPVLDEHGKPKLDEKGAPVETTRVQAMAVRKNASFTGGALDITLRDFHTLGADPNVDVGDLIKLLGEGKGDLDKNEVQITVGFRDHNGKTYNEVKYIDPVGGRAMVDVPASSADIMSYAARLKGYKLPARNSGSPNPDNGHAAKPAAAAAAPKPLQPSDDEIPF